MIFRTAFMIVFAVASLFVGSSEASQNTERVFKMDADTLCFRNSDPDLPKADPILGKLGVKKGICQGIAGLSAAFYENVIFDSTAPVALSSDRDVESFIRKLRKNYLRGMGERVKVTGFDNLKSFCRAHRMVFLRQAARFNLEIAIRDILPLYPTFLAHKSKPIDSKREQTHLKHFLESVRETVNGGRLALILVYSHVVAVQSVVEKSGAVDLIVYDSNHEEARTWMIQLDPDGMPSLGNRMYWDITSTRDSSTYDRF